MASAPVGFGFAILALFLVYAAWLVAVLGTVPPRVMAEMHSIQELLQAVKTFSESRTAFLLVTLFSQITMWVSFVAVSLSLFDTLMDFLGCPNTVRGRIQTALATLVPPMLFAMFVPGGFLLALKYTAVFGGVIMIVLPCIMAVRVRSLPP